MKTYTKKYVINEFDSSSMTTGRFGMHTSTGYAWVVATFNMWISPQKLINQVCRVEEVRLTASMTVQYKEYDSEDPYRYPNHAKSGNNTSALGCDLGWDKYSQDDGFFYYCEGYPENDVWIKDSSGDDHLIVVSSVISGDAKNTGNDNITPQEIFTKANLDGKIQVFVNPYIYVGSTKDLLVLVSPKEVVIEVVYSIPNSAPRFNGVSWELCSIKRFNGSSWEKCVMHYYDGTQWQLCSGG